MGYCFVPQCNHHGDKCSLYRFPRTPQRRKKWVKSCRRKDRGFTSYSRICSCHFSPKKKDQPTRFPWSVVKQLQFSSAGKKRRSSPVKEMEATDSSQPNPKVGSSQHCDVPQPDAPPQTAPAPGCPEDVTVGETDVILSNGTSADETGVISSNETQQESVQEKTCACEDYPERKKIIDLEERVQVLLTKFESSETNWAEEKSAFEKLVFRGDVMARAENYLLVNTVKELEEELKTAKAKFLFSQVESDDALISHYTGLPNKATFDLLVSLFDDLDINYYEGWKVVSISRRDQIFMTLMNLRRNFTHLDLATRFGVSVTAIANIAMTWVHAMHYVFFGAENSLLSKVPSRFKNQKHLPQCFKEYPNTKIVLDCTEVKTADPKLISKHNLMFSPYKHFVSSKGLVGIAPDGTITFVSELYPGNTSDKEIVKDCKILDQVERGDAIMADKGFLISSLLPSGVSINLPHFKETPQFTPEQIEQGYGIAQARVHVKRAIQRIKLYRILDYIPQFYLHVSSKIFQVCAALTNFRRGLIQEKTLDSE